MGTSDAAGSDASETEVTVRLPAEPSRPLGTPRPDDSTDAGDSVESDGRERSGVSAATSESGGPLSVELPRPPARFRDSDPTGASWWAVLLVGTVAWALVAALWSLPLALAELPVPSLSGRLASAAGGGVLLGLAVAALLRALLLPISLLRDATLLGRAEGVNWSPSCRLLGPAVLLAPLPTSVYYLLARRRYVGVPHLPFGDRFAFYEGRIVPSNWWVLVVVGVVLGGLVEGLVAASEALSALPAGLGTALSGPLLAVLLAVLFLRYVLVPLGFYLDATAVRRADVGWRPLALWYALGGLVLALPFGAFYLYRRVRYTNVGPF
ncbi:hypothetical protein [Halorarum halobium]|uniref:hypothetical protein n=1 Tax=Halorarum halobium TaxID=3075121 RepID=UPI0028A58E89|nr:hypothetical protein [Halobaculum sp. XH14]